jgi:hypothetical protein
MFLYVSDLNSGIVAQLAQPVIEKGEEAFKLR